MRRECRERFPRHRWLVILTCITARAWRTCQDACRDRLLAVSFEVGGMENVPGIPSACATCDFTYLARGPWNIDLIERLWLAMTLTWDGTVNSGSDPPAWSVIVNTPGGLTLRALINLQVKCCGNWWRQYKMRSISLTGNTTCCTEAHFCNPLRTEPLCGNTNTYLHVLLFLNSKQCRDVKLTVWETPCEQYQSCWCSGDISIYDSNIFAPKIAGMPGKNWKQNITFRWNYNSYLIIPMMALFGGNHIIIPSVRLYTFVLFKMHKFLNIPLIIVRTLPNINFMYIEFHVGICLIFTWLKTLLFWLLLSAIIASLGDDETVFRISGSGC